MVATLLQLNHSFAAVASLPALVLGHLHQPVRLLVFRTFSASVELAIASNTNLSATRTAPRISPSIRQVHANLGWFNPLPTTFGWTIKPVGSRILLVFLVPKDLEFVIEEPVRIL